MKIVLIFVCLEELMIVKELRYLFSRATQDTWGGVPFPLIGLAAMDF